VYKYVGLLLLITFVMLVIINYIFYQPGFSPTLSSMLKL